MKNVAVSIEEWFRVANELSVEWRIKHKSRSVVDPGDLRDFLVDLYLERGGDDPIFNPENRGKLFLYTQRTLGNDSDTARWAAKLEDICSTDEDDGGISLDRLEFMAMAAADDEAATPEHHLMIAEETASAESDNNDLNDFLVELEGALDDSLSGVLGEIFGVTDRRGREIAADLRPEKVRSIINRAAKRCGLSVSDVQKLVEEIVAEERMAGRDDDADRLARLFNTSAVKKRSPQVTKDGCQRQLAFAAV